jgi:hypothetical protein
MYSLFIVTLQTYPIHTLFRFPIVLIALFPVFLLIPQSSPAQMNQTLMGWEEETQTMIFNRYHSYGGVFYDRGLFRFTTPRFTDEHDLDLITFGFTPAEHYRWYYDEGNSFRTYMGSYNLGQFLHGAEMRNFIPLTDRLTFPLRFVRRYDMRTDRAIAFLGLDYQITGRHAVGLFHTLNEIKPDMDAVFYYRFGQLATGGIQLEFSPLDWGNNGAYELGDRRGTETPELRRYEVKPYLFAFKANNPIYRHFRVEAVGGVQTPLTALAESMPDEYPDVYFRDRDFARYAGVLAEFAHPVATFALSFRHTFTRFSRENEDENFSEPVDYGNRQIQNSFGIFAGTAWRDFYIQSWVWRNYNLDVQYDEHRQTMQHGIQIYPFDFREFRWQTQIRVGYNEHSPGFTTALEFTSDDRWPTENYIITDELQSRGLPYRAYHHGTLSLNNERLSVQFGYRFNSRSYFVVGASLDLDGDKMGSYWDRVEREQRSWFDGGFGRFVIYWD